VHTKKNCYILKFYWSAHAYISCAYKKIAKPSQLMYKSRFFFSNFLTSRVMAWRSDYWYFRLFLTLQKKKKKSEIWIGKEYTGLTTRYGTLILMCQRKRQYRFNHSQLWIIIGMYHMVKPVYFITIVRIPFYRGVYRLGPMHHA
jgi:hypothetical protein